MLLVLLLVFVLVLLLVLLVVVLMFLVSVLVLVVAKACIPTSINVTFVSTAVFLYSGTSQCRRFSVRMYQSGAA